MFEIERIFRLNHVIMTEPVFECFLTKKDFYIKQQIVMSVSGSGQIHSTNKDIWKFLAIPDEKQQQQAYQLIKNTNLQLMSEDIFKEMQTMKSNQVHMSEKVQISFSIN